MVTENNKILSLEKLAANVDALRTNNPDIKVGVTSGVFDMTHKGHINLFREAKNHCDYLIVIVASDDSVKRVKNPKGTIINQDDRADHISEFTSVDAVVISNEGHAHKNILTLIKPNIMFKGPDYQNRTDIAGGDLVSKVQILDCGVRSNDAKPHSTTDIIDKVIGRDNLIPRKWEGNDIY